MFKESDKNAVDGTVTVIEPVEEADEVEVYPIENSIKKEETAEINVPAGMQKNETGSGAMEQNMTDMLARNPRIEKILALESEVRRQNEQEKLRSKRIHQEQEYINKMMASSVEEMLQQTKEERKYNKEFEEQIRAQVYRMHGLSDDKIEGMREYHNAWYQGAAFSLFFLSSVLFILCGVLHGFQTEITLFMAFYTAIGGTFLTNGKHQSGVLGMLVKGLYLLLFPAMMAVFVCYELQFSSYENLLLVLTIIGAVILMLGVVSYFVYDPYREDRKRRRKAENYLREMEKTALKEVRQQEKAYDKQERKRKKREEKEEKKRKKEEAN